MSHQQLPSIGTVPGSAASGALRLVWRHRNPKTLLQQGESEALVAGQVHTRVAEAGKIYRVVNAQDQIVTPEKAQRQGNHLVIVLKGQVQIIIQDFFAHTGKKSAQDGDEELFKQTDAQPAVQVQSNLFATDIAEDAAPVWQYAEGLSLSPHDSLLVQSGSSPDSVLGRGMSQDIQLAQAPMPASNAMPVADGTNPVVVAFMGAVGIQVIDNEDSSPPNNALNMQVLLGRVKADNDLKVLVYKVVNGKVEDKHTEFPVAKVDENSRLQVDMGDYTGLVKIVVRNGGDKFDFYNDLTLEETKAADNVDLVTSYVNVAPGVTKVNVNHLTTVVAQILDGAGDKTTKALSDAYKNVATELGYADLDLQSAEVKIPSDQSSGNAGGVLNGVLAQYNDPMSMANAIKANMFDSGVALKPALIEFVKSKVGRINNEVLNVADALGVSRTDILNADKLGPVFQGDYTKSVAESLASGSVVYTAKALDLQAVTFSLTDDNFMINSSTGEITSKALLDFETKSTHTLTVTAKDAGNNTTTQAITISVTDVNEKPTLRKGATETKVFVVNQSSSVSMSDYFADPDANDTLTYKILEGNLPSGITLTSEGVLSGKATGVETPRTVKVVATDKAGGLVSDPVSFTISSVDKPTVTGVAITDPSGDAKVGKPSDIVTIVLTLGEAVDLTGSITGTAVNFKEAAGGADVMFTPATVVFDAANKNKITLTGTFQAGKNSDNLLFVSMALPAGSELIGVQSKSKLEVSGYSILSGYKLDSQVATPALMLASDTGMSSSDGISSLGLITVTGIEASATWQYSTNSGSDWVVGTGSSFSLATGSYAANAVQVRQTDLAGNSSGVGKNAASFTLDSTVPTLTTAQFDGTHVVLNFSEPVDSSSLSGAAMRFGFKNEAGAVLDTYVVNAVAAGASSNQVKLSLASDAQKTALATALSSNTKVNLTYTDLTAGNDATGVLQDLAGNDLATIAAGVGITYRPVVVAAAIVDNLEPLNRGKGGNPITITLTLSEDVELAAGQALTSVALTFKDTANGATVNLSPANAEIGAAGTKKLTFVGTLPATGNSDNLVLTNVTITSANNTPVLVGKAGGQAMQSQDYAFLTGYALDNTAPSAPVAALATDTGNATDGISSVGTVRVSNLASDLKSWEYNSGSGWVTGTGSAFTLASGTYAANSVKVRQTDTVGQTSGETNMGAITIAPPAAITPALASDTGSSASDGVTRIATLSVTGLEAGATWSFSTNGGTNWSPVNSGASTQLPVGSYAAGNIKVRQIDLANNSSADATLSGAVIVDTTAPTVTSASANADKLTLTFSESLTNAANFVPTASDFTVAGKTVSAVSVSGNQVVLTVSPAYSYDPGSTGTVTYTNGADATDLQDLAGNEVMSFSGRTFSNVTPDRPSISGGALKDVTNLDVRSDLVLSLNATDLTLVAGKKIKIINDNNTRGTSMKGYADSDAKFNDIEITITENGADVIGTTKILSQDQDNSALKRNAPNRLALVTETTPTALNNGIQNNNSSIKIIGNKLIINPCIDLDFTNAYHIEVEAGALIDPNQLTNLALVTPAETAFKTVLPAANTKLNEQANRDGTLSKKMTNAGALVDSYYWIDLEGRGDQTNLNQYESVDVNIFDAGEKSFAFAFADKTNAAGLYGSGFQVRMFNFGRDDLIYADSLGAPGEVANSFKDDTWNYNFDFAAVDAGVGLYDGYAAAVPPPVDPTLPKRVVSNFSAQGLRILLTPDPAQLGLLDLANPNMDTLEKVQASAEARFKNLLDFQKKLDSPDIGASLTTSLLAVDPNNMKLHFVLG